MGFLFWINLKEKHNELLAWLYTNIMLKKTSYLTYKNLNLYTYLKK